MGEETLRIDFRGKSNKTRVYINANKMSKIVIEQYHDWWFDNAVEFLGYLLGQVGTEVTWGNGISFEPLDKDKLERLREMIEQLVIFKLKYKTKDKKTGQIVEKNRAYLPTMHLGKYVSFLGLKITEKHKNSERAIEVRKEIIDAIGSILSQGNISGTKICDICGHSTDELLQVSQTTYPVVTGSLRSQCGVRKMKSEYHCCKLCAFLGSIEWLDDIPFACDHANFTHYLLFPKIEELEKLHMFKRDLRENVLNTTPYSNIISIFESTQGEKREIYAKDEYSLLLSLLEKMWDNHKIEIREENGSILCDKWIRLKIKGMEATYQTKYSYLEEIHIPHIERFKKIFEEWPPYSDCVSRSFASALKEGASREITQRLTKENQYLMSKGIIMDDFRIFSKAFQIRQNCRLVTPKEALNCLVYTWRCKDGSI